LSRIIATDISRQALDVARQNAETHGVADRIEFLLGDLLGPLQNRGLDEMIDFVACNPPYVPSSHPDLVQRDVREFEPALALYGGLDGLSFYRRLLVDALRYLRRGGYTVCELGFSQVDSVRAIVDLARWELLDVVEDLQGIPRTLTLRKR
jgi:release factor glutamine methyltransferase